MAFPSPLAVDVLLAVDVDFLAVNLNKSQNYLAVDSAFWQWIRVFGGGSDLLAVG